MAEFCLDCYNKYFGEKEQLSAKDVIMDYDLCEECGQWKPCVISIKKSFIQRIKTKISYFIVMHKKG